MRDHLLGWPGLLALIEPGAKPSHRTPERVRVVPQFVADSRTPDSDKPKVAAQKPVDAREASFLAFEASLDDSELLSRLIELRGGCRCYRSPPCVACSRPLTEREAETLGWEPPEAEKPAQAEPQFKPGDKVIVKTCGHRYVLCRQRGPGEISPGAWIARLEDEDWESAVFDEHELQLAPPATPQPDAEGWTPYSGQRCPLPMGTRYECERANGRRSTFRVDSGDFDPRSFWNHAPDDSERNRASWLVRYRVLVDA